MCEANAYLKEADKETLLMEAVDKVEPDENGIRLVSISGIRNLSKDGSSHCPWWITRCLSSRNERCGFKTGDSTAPS